MQQTELNARNGTLNNPGFDQLAQSLGSALMEFSKESPAILASIVSAVRPIGDYAVKGWNASTGYVRRHPVQVAAGVAGLVAIGFIASRMMADTAETTPRSSDGRQY